MSWQELYQSKLCSAIEAVKQIKNGDTVVFAHCVGEPPALVEAMIENAEQYKDVEIKHMVSLGSGGYTAKGMEAHFRVNPMFVSVKSPSPFSIAFLTFPLTNIGFTLK